MLDFSDRLDGQVKLYSLLPIYSESYFLHSPKFLLIWLGIITLFGISDRHLRIIILRQKDYPNKKLVYNTRKARLVEEGYLNEDRWLFYNYF